MYNISLSNRNIENFGGDKSVSFYFLVCLFYFVLFIF